MKMMRRLFTLLTALIVSFNILTVAAEGNPVQIDRSKKGSITMTLAEGDGKPVAGATFTLYKVGDIKVDNGYHFVLNETFEGSKAFVNDAEVENNTETVTDCLVDYAKKNGISGTATAVTDAKGQIVFSDLELGLYLAVNTKAASGYYASKSFLVSVPMHVDGEYQYDVVANPKPGTATEKPTPSNPPVTPSHPYTPFTGRLFTPNTNDSFNMGGYLAAFVGFLVAAVFAGNELRKRK